MKLVNRILRFIYAFFFINLIYNSNKFQCILKSYELSDYLIILILSVATFVILFVIDVIIDEIFKRLLGYIHDLYYNSIKKEGEVDPSEAMKYLKYFNLILEINVLLSPSLYYKSYGLSEKSKFFKISKDDKRLSFRFIIKIIINYVLITSTIYVLYMRTDYINNIITFIKELDFSSYKNIFKFIISPKFIGIIISLIGIFIYSTRKNKIKEIINKDGKNLEEEVTLKFKNLCKCFIVDRANILNNIYVLMKHEKAFLSGKKANISKTRIIYSESKDLMSLNNAEKLKSLIKYFLYNENCIYYFHIIKLKLTSCYFIENLIIT